MASGQSPNAIPAGNKKLVLLIPAIGVLVVIVVVAAMVYYSDPLRAEGRPMSDGSDGTVDDPDLKPLGRDGLKYRDLKEGTGQMVPPGATVTIHYTGWLLDGTVFDSSVERKEPATFPLGNLIQGWQQGIPGMKVGGIRKLVIPHELGYGDQKSGKIPGKSTLIFEVEVLAVQPGGMMMPGGRMPAGHP